MDSGRRQFLCWGPRTGASGQNVSPPTTDLKKSQQWSGAPVGRDHIISSFFMNEPVTGTPGHTHTRFRAKIPRIDCVRSLSRGIYSRKT